MNTNTANKLIQLADEMARQAVNHSRAMSEYGKSDDGTKKAMDALAAFEEARDELRHILAHDERRNQA